MVNYLDGDELNDFLYSSKAKQLLGLGWCMGFDNNQNSYGDWDDAKLRVLVSFLSTGPTRAVSNTYTMLDGLIHSVDGVFVDYSYYPSKEDLELYSRYSIPYMFGNVSHRSAINYDLIVSSHSVLVEFINMFHLLTKSGIPVYHKERLEPGSLYPLILAGGIPIQDHDAMGGNSGIPDLIYSGQGEGVLADIINWMKEEKPILSDLRDPVTKNSELSIIPISITVLVVIKTHTPT